MSALTRRRLLGTTAAGTAATAFTGLPAATAQPAGPDAVLLAACQQFEALERQFLATFHGPNAIKDDDEREAAIAPIKEAQKPFWRFICATPAKTLEEVQAKGRCTTLEDPDFMKDLVADLNSSYGNSRLQASLLLDVFAMLGIEGVQS